MASRPGDAGVPTLEITDPQYAHKQLGPPFRIEWIIQSKDAINEGLRFQHAAALRNPLEGNQCVNLSRNCQELESQVGLELCKLIIAHIQSQREERALLDQKSTTIPSSFFSLTEEEEASMVQETSTYWDTFLGKVRDSVGEVMLATVIGSRRYNLQSPASDLDLFVITVSPLGRVLQYPPTEQTHKNPESTRPDFTIHSVEYFCQLLEAGDTKIVECLFLHRKVVHSTSPLWDELVANREKFVTKAVIKTYISEVKGSKGLRQMEKLHQQLAELPEDVAARQRFFKKWYIVLRCLFHAEQSTNAPDVDGNSLTS